VAGGRRSREARVEYRWAQILKPEGSGRQDFGSDSQANDFGKANSFFAWRGVAWQGVSGDLGPRIFPSRAGIFFFGIPAGDMRFAPPALPRAVSRDLFYGMRTLKAAV